VKSADLSTSGTSSDQSGILAGVAAYLLWGFITVYWKALKEFAPLELIGYRIFMSVILLIVLLALRGRLSPLFRKLTTEHLWTRVSFAAILLAVNWTTYVVVVHEGKVIEAALGYFIAPLGTMLIGVKVLGEKIRPIQLASATIGPICCGGSDFQLWARAVSCSRDGCVMGSVRSLEAASSATTA